MLEVEKNGNAAEVVDGEESRVMENQALLDPSATPESLKKFGFGVGVPMPTRTMVRESAIALRNMAYPMFGNPTHYSPDSLEVGEARNQIVEMALADGVEWLFFMDYDVAPPPNALVKLLSHKRPITAGVYNSKEVPSSPLIFVKGWNHAFEDWVQGDLIKVDGIGMGCTLINMEVFRKIKKPWFKTVPGYSENSSAILPNMTEDIYFCEKAKAAGYDIIVDTDVQCHHVDWRTGIMYHRVPDANDPLKGSPGWTFRVGDKYVTQTVSNADHPGANWADTEPLPNDGKIDSIDLGSGIIPEEGYVGIDLNAPDHPGVIAGDISDLKWFRKEHGLVKRLRASHSLEHMSHRDIPRIFRDWVNTLDLGGEMEVSVPDGEFHMRAVLDLVDKGEDADPQCDWLNATIYGYQIGEGHEHKTMFTWNRLESLAKSCGLKEVKVERIEHKGDDGAFPTTAELVLTGRRSMPRTKKEE